MEEQNIDPNSLERIAAKVTEEAKKAEAHARASRAFARKVAKEADFAFLTAVKLLRISKDLTESYLEEQDIKTNATAEEFRRGILFDQYWVERGVCPSSLRATLNVLPGNNQSSDPDSAEVWRIDDLDSQHFSDLCLSDEQQELVHNILKEGIPTRQRIGTTRAASADHRPKTSHIVKVEGFGLQSSQNPALVVGTKRRSRKRVKTSAMGIPSPLLSREDLTIVKRSTSPNPSQTSGLIGTQHKFTVRRNRSSTSQQTSASVVDDDGQSVTSQNDLSQESNRP